MSSAWQKSSRSKTFEPECVEFRHNNHGGIDIRDSKNPDGLVLDFTTHEIAGFLGQVCAGVMTDFTGEVQVTLMPSGGFPYRFHRAGNPNECLEFNQGEMTAFVAGARAHEFDQYTVPMAAQLVVV